MGTDERPFAVRVGDVLSSASSRYLVLKMMGIGGHGHVFKARNMDTNDLVVLKLPTTPSSIEGTQEEVKYLKKISSLGHPNMIKYLEDFEYKGYPCVVLEMLHMDLYNMMDRSFDRIELSKIRTIAKQVFGALHALNRIGILHADVKPDNIMLANSNDLKAKLIDFGLAYHPSEIYPGMVVQAVPYRAPEVLLGLPFSYGIDMWGMGCVLASLFLKDNLFSVASEYKMMSQLVKLLGQPEDHQLRKGLYSRKYFVEVEGRNGPAWRLKTPEEYNLDATEKVVGNTAHPWLRSLDDLLHMQMVRSAAEYEDQLQFLDLIKSLLNMDAAKRISASEALTHPFITMSHLLNPRFKSYLSKSIHMMSCCKEVDSAVDEHADDGGEEQQQQQAEDKEQQGYTQQSGDGKYPGWGHLEGLEQPVGEQLKSELEFSTWGSPTSLFRTPVPVVAPHDGWGVRTDTPAVETAGSSSGTKEPSILTWLQTSWTNFTSAFTCCFGVDD